jgi:quercetin dioxygenase-like cupin family protein
MSISITEKHFEDRDQAIQLIEARGLFARDGAMQSGDLEDIHWHKTSLLIYVLDGSFETRDVASSTVLLAGRGDLISIPARTLHAARCPVPAMYVVGFESEQAAKIFRPEKPDEL